MFNILKTKFHYFSTESKTWYIVTYVLLQFPKKKIKNSVSIVRTENLTRLTSTHSTTNCDFCSQSKECMRSICVKTSKLEYISCIKICKYNNQSNACNFEYSKTLHCPTYWLINRWLDRWFLSWLTGVINSMHKIQRNVDESLNILCFKTSLYFCTEQPHCGDFR